MPDLPPPRPTSMPEPPAFPRDSRYRQPRRWVSWWGLLIGMALGIGGGLFYAWNVAPVVETDTLPRQLNDEAKRHYAVAVMLDYRYNSDLALAIGRLTELYPDRDPIQEMATVACDLARSGYIDSSSGLRAVQTLKTFYQLQGRTGCADTLIPDSEVGPLEVTVIVPTPTQTPPPPPSKTPTPFVQPSPTTEGVIIVPTTRPRLAYEGRVVDTFCDLELAGMIEIFVQDFNSQGIPGEPIRVRWEDKESTFVSGLKPERGAAYADFQMEAGKSYIVEMPALSDPLPNTLTADSCFTPNGEASVKSYRVVFNPTE